MLNTLSVFMKKTKIQVVLVDDHELMTESLGALLEAEPDLHLAGRAGDGEAGLALCRDKKPDLALIDMSLPKMDGVELAKHLQSECPKMRILMMSGHSDPYTVWRISQSDVHGYVEKTASLKLLVEAIRNVAQGQVFFTPKFQKVLTEWLTHPEAFQNILSKREVEVLALVAEGNSDETIAKQFKISIHTVAVHRRGIRQKLRIHNDREMIAYARVWGLGKDMGTQAPAVS